MKLLIGLALSLSLTFAPALAQVSTLTPLQQSQSSFVLQQLSAALSAAGIPIISLRCVANQMPSATTVTIIFDPSATTDQQATAQAMLAGANLTPPAPPNVDGFIKAINADPLTTANNFALVFQMGSLLAIFQADMTGGDVQALQTHWQSAIVNYGPSGTQGTWLTLPVQVMIQGYANAYNIPVVAQ